MRWQIQQVPGVSAAEVELELGRAYVVCDKAVADSALTSAVHRAGPNFLGYVVRK